VLGSSLALVDATNNLSAISKSLLGVESAVLASHTLADDFSVFVDEDKRASLIRVGETTSGEG